MAIDGADTEETYSIHKDLRTAVASFLLDTTRWAFVRQSDGVFCSETPLVGWPTPPWVQKLVETYCEGRFDRYYQCVIAVDDEGEYFGVVGARLCRLSDVSDGMILVAHKQNEEKKNATQATRKDVHG